ncbi:MotA/TolQ/ExbB proton channel family protein [Flavicella sp.]|uniref:MotA/TolQ/ExbB proton channel family protein n=1 Tax=Flavicella sp. TaxID=2957742 RepID=UPI0026278CB0|nr:MotA/TolQ/ExbB proton channel family protein [Flavicella sp.]MDG1805230.1 MotA/TolQ/ExbB proton channel family protein [Flavicella sp.]
MKFLNDGGPLFMYSLLLLLAVIVFLLIKVFISKTTSPKSTQLINSIGLFTLTFGILGQIIGLLSAFSYMQQTPVSQQVIAAGLKISFYPTVFGIFIFLISKLGLIAFTWSQKDEASKS